MSARKLSLHPSALSDAEHALFTASLADLAGVDADSHGNNNVDWEGITVSVREARAWLCGRHASLGTATIDQILWFFPGPTLDGGAFFALLRLVLHTEAGSHIDRSLVFVQAPISDSAHWTTSNANPFLPTPAPSPDSASRPRTINDMSTNRYRPSSESSTTSESASTSSSSMSASAASASAPTSARAPARRTRERTHGHGYSASYFAAPKNSGSVSITRTSGNVNFNSAALGSPPTPASSSSVSASAAVGSATLNLQRMNPFRAPPLPLRRTSTCTSAPVLPFVSNSCSNSPASTSDSGDYSGRPHTAPSTRWAFPPSGAQLPPLPSNINSNSASSSSVYPLNPADTFGSVEPSSPLDAKPRASTSTPPPGSPFRSPADLQQTSQFAVHNGNADAPPRAYPASANPRISAFSTSTDKVQAQAPSAHPHRRGTSSEDAYGEGSEHSSAYPLNSNSNSTGSISTKYGTSREGRRVRSDSAASSAFTPSSASFAPSPNTPAPYFGPLTLPKPLRRTLAGAGWVGAERGEREGLVRGASESSEYTRGSRGRDARWRSEEGAQERDEWEEGEGEEWGAL